MKKERFAIFVSNDSPCNVTMSDGWYYPEKEDADNHLYMLFEERKKEYKYVFLAKVVCANYFPEVVS